MLRVYSDRRCLEHAVPSGMPEVPYRLASILDRLENEPYELLVGCEHAGWRAAVEAVHDPAYVARLERAIRRGDGLIDSADTPLSSGTWSAAQAAVETALSAVEWVSEPDAIGRRAFVAVRPPGHHAERSVAMGFCYFGNVAVAADHLIRVRGLERVAIFDFDVHHGNGTQHLFEERADIFFASVHQAPFYPGTGAASETGVGDGRGATLNVPLPSGCGDERYAAALEREIVPALAAFAPQALLVSAGFDAWQGDPLGGMRVSRDGFEAWGRRLGALADELCDGRVVALLEGGYDLDALPDLVVAFLAGLSDGSSELPA